MYRLTLFGGASIDGPEGPLTGRGVQRRRLALLALLARARERGVSRDKLVAYLWPDSDTERARHLLSDSIYRINQAVGGDAIVAVGDALRLDTARLPSDADEFAAAMERGEWQRAVELHVAPFLDGFYLTGALEFERWVEQERVYLAAEKARALETLAQGAEGEGRSAEAVRWWRLRAAEDPFSSRIALRLMRALEQAHDRVAAIRHARIHAELVRAEHGVEPDPAVQAFADELSASPPPRAPERSTSAPTPGSVLDTAAAGTSESSSSANEDSVRRGSVETRPDGSHSPRRWTRAVWIVGGLALLIVLAIRVVARPTSRDTSAPTAIAVLPFRDLSPGGDEAYFADGITEELMVRLARIDGLRVMGRTSSFVFRDADVREVAARLGVHAILEGSVRRAGERLRIAARLVNAADGYELWSEAYEREMDDIFAIQDDIARAIVTRLRGRLAGADAARQPRTPVVDDPEAYNLYLRGRFEWHRRSEDGLRRAVSFFQRAVEREPDYARAYAGLGDAYAVLGFYDYLPPDDAFPSAARAAERALQIDPDLAAAHATLGYVALYYDWDFPRSEVEFRRTIDLDPGYSTGRQWYANLLTAMGRFDEAVAEMRAAQDLDPLSRIANAALGWVLFHAGEHEAAVEQLRRTIELDPSFELAWLWRGQSLTELNRLDEALEDLQVYTNLSGGAAIGVASLSYTLARAGQPDSARSLLRGLEARGGYLPAYEIAKALEALGDRPAAIQQLETALQQRSHSMVFLAVDPQLRSMHDDPAYLRILREVGLQPPPRR